MTNKQEPLDWVPLLLQGALDAQRASQLKEWKAASEDNQKAFAQAVKIWELANPPREETYDHLAAWEKVKHNLNVQKPTIPISKKSFNPIRWVAAAAVIAIVGSLLWTNFNDSTDDVNFAVTEQQKADSVIVLEDGTKVWLNKKSKLQFPELFSSDERLVHLDGEAFFDVAKDAKRPFRIVSGNTVTSVLGTSFNLRAYAEEAMVEVVVASGKVAFEQLKEPESQVVLVKDETGFFDKKTNRVKKKKNEDPNIFSWNKNKLAYDNTDFELIQQSLERHFNVNLEVEDASVYSCRFTSTFEQPKLESVLTVLAASLNFNFKLEGDRVMISGDGCSK